jgi:hypothetical protein
VPIYSELDPTDEPRWIRGCVERLLASLPDSYCRGLGAVVLTSTSLRLKRKQRRMRRNRGHIPLGTYHPAWKGNAAWIELVVDVIVTELPSGLCRVPLFRDVVVGNTLFHEIGHHLDHSIGSVGRTGEHSAEAWSARLSRRYLRQQYWYLRPAAPLFRLYARLARSRAGTQR